MVRGVLATIGGIAVAIFIVMLVQMLGHALFPPPSGLDPADPEQLAAMMDQVPFASKLAVVLAWLLGAMGGAAAARFVAADNPYPGWIVIAFMIASAMSTTQMFPHPVWMVVCAAVLPIAGKILAEPLVKHFRS